MFRQNHTEETKTIMSDAKKGENNSMFGQNHSDETKKKKCLRLSKVNK